MEEAAAVRGAAEEAVRDVVPGMLREEISGFVESGSVVPGTLTLVVADLFGEVDPDVVDGLTERAAGVQLIYDGLRLTRRLVHGDPWSDAAEAEGDLSADMEILAADVLVSRGFYLLARTEAAGAAVEVVRSFGRDQTNRRELGDPSLDRELERDVVELAVLAGATAVGAEPPDAGAFAADLVGGDAFPPAGELLTEEVVGRLADLGGHEVGGTAATGD
ncbi:MAG: hypothetical protein V5A61_02250 [Haloarculaceae archaeon]